MQCTQVSQEHFSRQMTFRITKSLLSYSFEGANVESLLGSSPLSPLAKKKNVQDIHNHIWRARVEVDQNPTVSTFERA